MARKRQAQHRIASVEDLGEEIQDQVAAIQKRVVAYQRHANIMQSILDHGEARRLERSFKVSVKNFSFQKNKVKAVMHGSQGATYNTYLEVSGQGEKHDCDCPDFVGRGRSVGPCKHILHLSRYWLNERVGMRLEKIARGLATALE
jgi:uncharacterized Zn finger protein